MSAIDTRRLREIAQSEYEIVKQAYEARDIKLISTSPPQPPKGYYMTQDQVAKYRSDATAYNVKVREYRTAMREALSEVRANRRSRNEYERLSRTYLSNLKRSMPQQIAYREQQQEFGDYLRSVGPPVPTEEQRARQEAGIPQRGLPGPGQPATPESPLGRLQPVTGQVFRRAEAPFLAVTGPIREVGQLLERLSHDAMRTERAYQPSPLLGAQTQPITRLDEPFMVEAKPKPVVGTAAYLASVGFDVAAAAVDVGTFELRPGLMAESAGAVLGLAIDPKVQEAFREKAVGDPFRFMSTVVGGAVFGADIKATIERVPGDLTKWWARREFERLGLDESMFTPFERELLFDFPEETVDFRSTQRLFKRKALVTDKGEIPYYLETSPEVEKLLSGAQPESPWSPDKIAKEVESYYALPFSEEGPAILVRGKAGMKPFAEATAKLPARAEQVSIVSTKMPSMQIPEASFFKTSMIEETVTHIPAVDLRSTLLTTPGVMVPSLFPAVSISTLLSIPSIPMQETKLKDITKQIFDVPQLQKQITTPDFELGQITTPKPIQVQISIPSLTQEIKPITIQKPEQIQFTMPRVPQMTLQEPPMPSMPDIPAPVIPFSPSPPKTLIPAVDEKKKKKKRKVTKRKGVYERRVDPLKITFPKVPKVPKL